MSWIGRKIYQYLKECEDFKKDIYGGYQPKDKLDTSNQPKKDVPKTDNVPQPPERKIKPYGICTESCRLLFCNDANIYLKYSEKLPERKPFENFKNNRKKMKKEVIHKETHVVTSVENEGTVTLTIEPKKGHIVESVGLEVIISEIPKERVFPKDLLNPTGRIKKECDTLAKLIFTRDYYNAGHVLHGSDMVAVIINRVDVDGITPDTIAIGGMTRFDFTKSKLYFIDIKTAMKFLENFREQIESVKHLI